jgi:uncharacterized lipoprotein YddW (UPF0748 family)
VRYFEGDSRRWGYNPTSLARFNQQLGRDQQPPDPNDPDWTGWRRDQVTALVRRIYLEAKALKPHVAVSAAVVTWGTGPHGVDGWQHQAPFAGVFQDWRYWLQEGILDYALPMDYYRETDDQTSGFDTWTRWAVDNRGRRGVVIGVGAYLNASEASLAQLGRARALGPLGIAIYSYAVPGRGLEPSTPQDRDALAWGLRTLFGRPAPVPDLAWLNHSPSGGLLVDLPGHEAASVVLDGAFGSVRAWRTDGTGLAGGTDIPPGHYSLSVASPDVDPVPVEVSILPGSTTVVRFRVD